jgi:predicted outer membrane repeat protein
MDAPKTVTVTWTTQYKLTTTVSPEGSGTVELSPAGEDGYYYDEGAVVTLTANPETGYIFGYWSGDLSGGNNRETLNMNEPKSVTANFALLAIYVDGASGQDTNDGLTWETAVKTVQKGLDLAPATGWTVLVANGTYTGTDNKNLDFKGKAILLQSAGGAENCIIDCQISGRGFYFHSGETEATIVEGLTIRNGRVFGDWPDSCGGGITCLYGSSPTITNCTFSENSAGGGGAIYCKYSSSPAIMNCTFSDNSAAYLGGAVYCRYYSSPTMTDCTFSGNSAGGGGAVYGYLSSPSITDCTFGGNLADSGGAVYGGSGTITNCAFSGNLALEGSGGAVHGSSTITNCTFNQNSAMEGGAVYGGGSMTDCTFSENSADSGGAVYGGGSVTNCTFSGNSAVLDGGAVYCDRSSPTITNCTFSGNSARGGGAVYCRENSSPTINNCVLWDNSARLGNEIYVEEEYFSPPLVTLNNCDVTPGGYWDWFTGSITENNCIHLDPLFVDAAGGNYRLQATSPCIDAGDNSLVPVGITTDLDGNARIQNGTVDMGAYEYQP